MTPDNLQVTLLLADCQLRLGQNSGVIALLTPIEQPMLAILPSPTF